MDLHSSHYLWIFLHTTLPTLVADVIVSCHQYFISGLSMRNMALETEHGLSDSDFCFKFTEHSFLLGNKTYVGWNFQILGELFFYFNHNHFTLIWYKLLLSQTNHIFEPVNFLRPDVNLNNCKVSVKSWMQMCVFENMCALMFICKKQQRKKHTFLAERKYQT